MEEFLTIKNVIIYLLAINIITFLAMGFDKFKAKKGHWRTPEKTLIMLVVLGGGIGGIAGMKFFRHKTKKPRFYIGFPMILILEIVIAIVLLTIKYFFKGM